MYIRCQPEPINNMLIKYAYVNGKIVMKSKIFRYVSIVFLFLYIFQLEISKLSIMHILALHMAIFILYDSFIKNKRKLILILCFCFSSLFHRLCLGKVYKAL